MEEKKSNRNKTNEKELKHQKQRIKILMAKCGRGNLQNERQRENRCMREAGREEGAVIQRRGECAVQVEDTDFQLLRFICSNS